MRENSHIIAKIILIIYTFILVGIAFYIAMQGFVIELPIQDLQNSEYMVTWVVLILLGLFGIIAATTLLYILLFNAFVNRRKRRRFFYRLFYACFLFFFTYILAALFITLSFGLPVRIPGTLYLALPILGCFFGSFLCMSWFRRKTGLFGYIFKLGIIVAFSFCAIVGIVYLSLEKQPLDIQTMPFSSEDKRYVVGLIKGKDPRKFEDGHMETFELKSSDINKVLGWGLVIDGKGRKMDVELEENRIGVQASMELPYVKDLNRFLNVTGRGRCDYGKIVWFECTNLKIGRLNIPPVFVKSISHIIFDIVTNDRHVQPFLAAVHSIELSKDKISVTYGPVTVSEEYMAEVRERISFSPDLTESINANLEALATLTINSTSKRLTFKECLVTAFKTAQQRSGNNDSLLENQASILALSILIGHERISTLVGPITIPQMPSVAWKRFYHIPIRGRTDWSKHFLVSASLEILSNIAASYAIGLLKEELDADAKGSGFSFADLLADRTGTTFAVSATKNKSAAIKIQDRIINNFKIDDFFPPGSDLPEKIYDDEFKQKYGGIGGQLYNQILEDIDTRISKCAAYK